MKHLLPSPVTIIATVLPLLTVFAGIPVGDVAWIDINPPAGGVTAPYHLALPATTGAAVSNNGITFTLFGTGTLDGRDRLTSDPLLTDFAFLDGANAAIGVRIAGLPAGTYSVESWHYDASFGGTIQVEFRPMGGSSTVLVDAFGFATTPATYSITVDGTSTYELLFREDDGNKRSRLNGLRIRRAGTASIPPGILEDISPSNTAAAAGSPSPFFTDSATDVGFTNGPLWRRRTGFGFDLAGNREVFEKDANGGIGDAATLATVITGLTPGAKVGVHVAYLSVATETWQVKAGLSSGSLTLFTPTTPTGKILNLGLSSETGSNRNQYLGFIGNSIVASNGTLTVYSDDGDGTNAASRSFLEGFYVTQPGMESAPPDLLPPGTVEIAPDGAWTWFNDERAIWHRGALYAGYVRADGHVGLARYNPATGTATQTQLSTATSQQKDDHNNPSLTPLSDGTLLAIYSKHSTAKEFYLRRSLIADPAMETDWAAEVVQSVPANNTYANTYRLTAEANKIFSFHRCINFNPTLSLSLDEGLSWGNATHFISNGSGSVRPYPRYCSNRADRVDLIYTDGHPRDVNNSIFHLYYRDSAFRRTDGTIVKTLANLPLDHAIGERGSVVYPFSTSAWGQGQGPNDWIPNGRGWTWDIHYGKDGNPVCAFQVQRDNVTGTGWNHDRIYYYYARWTGSAWQRRFIAQGGRGLYSSEDDYGGGMALDPEDCRIVYISSNAANPFDLTTIDNIPLRASERYEIWRGFTADGGLTFSWTQLTMNSSADNLRPIIPEDHGRIGHLLWFRGTYTSFTSYNTRVVAALGTPKEGYNSWLSSNGLTNAPPDSDTDGDGLPTLLEYTLGGDPRDEASRPLPRLENGKYYFTQVPARTDVESVIETSFNLTDWTTVATVRNGGLPSTIASGYSLEQNPSVPGEWMLSPIQITPGQPGFFVRLHAVVR